jgi:antitoxin component YwqK of YwqJK toxin-antitoxin module
MFLGKIVFILSVFIFSYGVLTAQPDTLFNQTDAGNLKQGWWKKDYPNGKPIYKGFFKDDKPVGLMTRYFETGLVKAILFYDSKGEYASAKLFYEDGQLAAEGRYYNSLKDSIWKYYSYYDHALTARELYDKGKRNGIMEHFYNNGNLSEKIGWKNDRKNGTWEQYYNNNILKLKGSYADGKLEGEFVVNYNDGKPYLKGKYLNDLRHGKWIFYTEDGLVDMELEYLNGKTKDEDKLDEKQQQLFNMIDENQGKFEEPDETNFIRPAER